ncbi:MAG: DNA gyrase subunit A [Proteobacteria bacterium]|nr:DNA gyrase subunit A [Pseudomonadota bacterium]
MSDTPSPPAASSASPDGIAPISIEDELKRSYLDYAMSVIVSRALPDARDGLKPVHRRILYSMHELGMTPDKGYSKSARVVGDVLGRFHPHGDASVYDALVRMAQDFSMGLTLIDGQGNFGSVDGDPAASMRYTECRMTRAGASLLADIDKDVVDFQPNYDGREQEPVVLPARIPNLLVNGAGGIAVGMATNIPPHNLGEIVDACLALIDDPALPLEQLLEIVPGPDFPTGGEIIGRTGARDALLTGRGSVVVRAKTHTETVRGREAIVVDELPYQVNKKTLQERISELVREKRIEGIAHMQDESDRQGMRLVIECRRDATPDVVLNQLHRFTAMQSSFGVNMLALNRGRPEQMGLRALLDLFLEFREEVVVRRTRFELNRARDRGHVLVGLAIAVVNIDEVIAIIRSSKDPTEARERLMARDWPVGDMDPLIRLIEDPRTRTIEDPEGLRVRLTDEQARAILALTLSRLTGLGRDEIFDEARALADTIRRLLEILGDRALVLGIVRQELVDVRDQFAVSRRSVFVDGDADLEDEDLIAREEMVVTVTHGGYVKRTPLATYRTQRRGGRGRSAMATKDEDAVTRVFSASTHAPVLFFSSEGKVYTLKVWRIPVGLPNTRGRSFNNLLPLEAGETITSILPLPEDPSFWERTDVMFATQSGGVRRNKLSDFQRINRAGKIAMKLDEGDHIVGVALCTEDQDVLLTTALGRCIRFAVNDVRVFAGRESTGVRGIRLLGEGDRVISMAILRRVSAEPAERLAYLRHASAMRAAAGEPVEEEPTADNEEVSELVDLEDAGAGVELGAVLQDDAAEASVSPERIAELGAAEEFILTLTDAGYGKRTSSYDYRRSRRGGQGIAAFNMERRGGRLVASFPVEDTDGVLLVTDAGQLIRVPVDSIRIAGRNTQGVTILRTAGDERVVSVERVVEPAGSSSGDDGGAAPDGGEG